MLHLKMLIMIIMRNFRVSRSSHRAPTMLRRQSLRELSAPSSSSWLHATPWSSGLAKYMLCNISSKLWGFPDYPQFFSEMKRWPLPTGQKCKSNLLLYDSILYILTHTHKPENWFCQLDVKNRYFKFSIIANILFITIEKFVHIFYPKALRRT